MSTADYREIQVLSKVEKMRIVLTEKNIEDLRKNKKLEGFNTEIVLEGKG